MLKEENGSLTGEREQDNEPGARCGGRSAILAALGPV